MHTFALVAPLPALTEDGTTIDGYTAQDAVEGPLGPGTTRVIAIEIDGSAGGCESGITFDDCSECAIRGLSIKGDFTNYVRITGSSASGNTIEGNYLGTDAGGTTPSGCSSHGILIENEAHDNLIGGVGLDVDNVGNLLSASGQCGIRIRDASDGNEVQGNYIGTDVTGGSGLGNSESGVDIKGEGSNNDIGGENYGEGNLVSGNGETGISVEGGEASYNNIRGNWVGLNRAGDAALPNGSLGVQVDGGHHNTIGGGSAEMGNVVSGNGRGWYAGFGNRRGE